MVIPDRAHVEKPGGLFVALPVTGGRFGALTQNIDRQTSGWLHKKYVENKNKKDTSVVTVILYPSLGPWRCCTLV